MNIVGIEAADWLGWWQKFKSVILTHRIVKVHMSVVGSDFVNRLRQLR
jgi:hypothetical protein